MNYFIDCVPLSKLLLDYKEFFHQFYLFIFFLDLENQIIHNIRIP